MKKIKVLFLFFLSIIILSSCKDNNTTATIEGSGTNTNTNISVDKDKDTETDTDTDKGSEEAEDVIVMETLKVYTFDIPENVVTSQDVEVDSSKNLEEKINILLKRINEDFYANTNIELEKIEESNGKKIAVVSLKDGTESFQKIVNSSATGEKFTTTLNYTILQKEYTGEWIDGVRYLYNGVELDGKEETLISQHGSFVGTYFRN